ncbi:MAG: bifunctional UDP-N-acetylglucosamine diphosphorylase/glucosamine-1-phosphate N-acetyltransferase GlmU [Acidobacteria bacterium]|nr:bifunctional UDP-N-acetylglucosamine diphosphorylase/glucosamine-1-phosphate N-acetyltransferase GlmU [Acidobacteriota bacterium]
MSATPDIHVVILAAGKGTRMKAARPKVLHPLGGMPLIEHVVTTARALGPASMTLVIGHQGDEVKAALARQPGLGFVVQEPQLGTGHALLVAEPVLAGTAGVVLLLYGDVPLLTAATARALIAHHLQRQAAATVLTARTERPTGYGRIVRGSDGRITRIVEERDASADERRITEINSGVYVFDLPAVFETLHRIGSRNAQGEYYLTDIVQANCATGRVVETVCVTDFTEIRGVNSQLELAELGAELRDRRARAVMAAGVTVIDPGSTWIGVDVEIGADTILYPNTWIAGRTRIGRNCEIQSGSRLVDVEIGNDVLVRQHTVIEQSRVGAGAKLGPFTHLRPDSDVGNHAHVGNFVELKKTVLGEGAKANHLAYLGDATVGARANIGAGTITCNYDGVHKHQTTIGEGAFIGSDSQLVAPVSVGDGAYVAAGSTITQPVPPGALGISRTPQTNKDGWVSKRRSGAS